MDLLTKKQIPFQCFSEIIEEMLRDTEKTKDQQTLSISRIVAESTKFPLSPPKTFECPFINCKKKLNSLYRLKIHQGVHAGIKAFKCIHCNKSFAEKGNLKTHLRSHTGERPYICNSPDCKSSYKVYSHLKDHINSVHLKRKPFICLLCQKTFSRKDALKTHSKRHANYQEPNNCGKCKIYLTSKRNRFSHNKICSYAKELVLKSEESVVNSECNLNDWSITEDFDFMKERSSSDLFHVFSKKNKKELEEIELKNVDCDNLFFSFYSIGIKSVHSNSYLSRDRLSSYSIINSIGAREKPKMSSNTEILCGCSTTANSFDDDDDDISIIFL